MIYNETSAEMVIKYKDIAIYSQKNQYLKRIYWMKNAVGRNQIYDRINMLAEFYSNAVLLRYEHPVMIVTNTKEIFLKRLRRMKKMIASDCSSDESEQQQSEQQDSDPLSFESSKFLRTIKSQQLQSAKNERSRSSLASSNSVSYDESIHNVYSQKTNNLSIKPKALFKQIPTKQIISQSNDSIKFNQIQVKHLIIDIDDVNLDKAINDYKKIENIQNKKNQIKDKDKSKSKKQNLKKSNIIITPIDYYVPDQASQQSFSKNEVFYPKISPIGHKYTKKNQPSRYKQYDETIRVGDRYQKNYKVQGSFQNNKKPETWLETERQYISIHDKYEVSNPLNRKSQIKTRISPDYQEGYAYHYTQDNSNQQDRSRKMFTKQDVRERAMALLKRVRSDQRFPVYDYRRSQIQPYKNCYY